MVQAIDACEDFKKLGSGVEVVKNHDMWGDVSTASKVLGLGRAFKAEGLLAMALAQVLPKGAATATVKWGRDVIRVVLADVSGNLVAEDGIHPVLLYEARNYIG